MNKLFFVLINLTLAKPFNNITSEDSKSDSDDFYLLKLFFYGYIYIVSAVILYLLLNKLCKYLRKRRQINCEDIEMKKNGSPMLQ